jgi:16S rRNA (guanine527-N7)-methyltransferase
VKPPGRDSEATGVATLARRYGLGEAQIAQLAALARLVANDPAAPTTVREPGGILRDHLSDSLVGMELDCVSRATAIADLGAGAGFPGLPLAIAMPRAAVSLVESSGRKCVFLERAIETCGVANADVVRARAEEWRAGLGSCDLVVARALAPLAVVAEYAAPLLRVGGSLVAWRGGRDPGDEAAGARAASVLGLEPAPPLQVKPYAGAVRRHLHTMVKIAETPDRFPRRPGVARRRPLGAI